TRTFTSPMMKKIGYSRTFADAVESTASVGGQILPPGMGASALIMADTLCVPYATLAISAIGPALVYYISPIVQIHLRVPREGRKGVYRENLPAVWDVLKERGHLLIPLLFLIYMLFFSGRTILYSALLTIIVTVVMATLRKSTRMNITDIIGALEDGVRQTL